MPVRGPISLGTGALAALSCLTVLSQSGAQQLDEQGYRVDVPPTLQAPALPRDTSDDVIAAFARAYGAAGEPRIVAFWNREFSDRLVSEWNSVTRKTETTDEEEITLQSENAISGPTGTQSNEDADRTLSIRTHSETREGHELLETPRRPGMNELGIWNLEAAFSQTFAQAGVRLIDRATIMRTAGSSTSENIDLNVQSIETSALLDKTDLLMEILMTPDQGSPLGFAFKVDVTDVKTGMVIANTFTRAIPANRVTTRYVATQAGFEKQQQPQPTLNAISRQLALETMLQLGQAL